MRLLLRPARLAHPLAPRRRLGGPHPGDPHRVRRDRRPARHRPAAQRLRGRAAWRCQRARPGDRAAADGRVRQVRLPRARPRGVRDGERRRCPGRLRHGPADRDRPPRSQSSGRPPLEWRATRTSTSRRCRSSTTRAPLRPSSSTPAATTSWTPPSTGCGCCSSAGSSPAPGLAALAGLWVAGRAMRPIASLTATAREIASTRDTSRRIPEPERDDEVAELARTLDQMLRELDAARSESQQMMQAQREFIADASHELRTPLTSILANLELLHEELDEAERSGEQGEIVAGALGLLAADAPADRRPAAAGPRRRRTKRGLPRGGPRRDRRGRPSRRFGPSPASTTWSSRRRARVGRRRCRTSSTASLSTCSTTASGTHPPASTIRIASRDATATGPSSTSATTAPGSPPPTASTSSPASPAWRRPGRRGADSGTGLGLAIVQAVATSHGGTVAGRGIARGRRPLHRLAARSPWKP